MSDEFQVSDALADRDFELMGEDDARKCFMSVVPTNSLSQEILVLAEQDATQCGRSVKKGGIRKTRGSILLRGEDIHPMETESVSNRFGNVDVHVEGETQGS